MDNISKRFNYFHFDLSSIIYVRQMVYLGLENVIFQHEDYKYFLEDENQKNNLRKLALKNREDAQSFILNAALEIF